MKKHVKKVIVLIIVAVLGLFCSLAYFNNSLNTCLSLSYLYFKNSNPIIFGKMKLFAPFNYVRSFENNDLTLTKFPVNGTHIYINSNYDMSIERFKATYSKFLSKGNIIINREGEIKIDKQDAYSISSYNRSSPLPLEEDICIPEKKTLIIFFGKEEDLPVFSELIRRIRFTPLKDSK